MTQTLTIARRELTSLFFSPIGYVVIGLFAIATTLIFFLWFTPDAPAGMEVSFWWVVWFMIFLLPATSMRLLSEEYRSGTIETLMTSPLSDAQVILGKWLGVMGFLLVLSVPLWIQALVIELNGSPDPGPILTGFLGLLLVGSLYLAIGAFASAATENQVNAFLITVAVISIFTFVTRFLPYAAFVKNNDFLRNTMFFANINTQFEDFNRGLIDTSNIVFFVSATIFFLFLAVMLLQSRRWR
ncbi:MAG: ABC transporter permease subunit [Phycisphaeraceae bacterium]|nr:ABC transporter permease subunit [Phycisphaeraceae bacterium]